MLKVMLKLLGELTRGWFIILCVALMMGIAVAPQLARHWSLMLDIGWRATLVCALLAASSRKKELYVALGVSVISTAFGLVEDFAFREVGQFLDICILIYAVLRILRFVFRGKVNTNTIFAAVCVYLMMGQIFAQLMALYTMFYRTGIIMSATGAFATMEELVYFSYTTLTTTGFGDFHPVTPFGRTIVVLEALSGQLFLVLFIGRLVGLHVSRKAMHYEFSNTVNKE